MRGTFNILRRGACLAEIREDHFLLEVANDMALRYANDNAADLKKLMEKHTGRKLGMECRLSDKKEKGQREKSTEEVACELGNCLNINIMVK